MAKARIPKSARFTAKSVRPPQGLPDRETLLKFIREALTSFVYENGTFSAN